ncbi:MAG: hypothetical protein AB1414_19160 [bacterium]
MKMFIQIFIQQIQQKRFWLFVAGSMILIFLLLYIHSASVGITFICGLLLSLTKFCFFVSIFLLVIGGVIAAILKDKTLLKVSFYATVALSFVIIIVIPGIRLINKIEIDGSKKAAYEIIEALETYKNKEGKYPEKLEDLIPQYLIKIPTAKTKRPFLKFCNFSYYRKNSVVSEIS